MAEHADSAERLEDDAIFGEGGDVGEPEAEDAAAQKTEKPLQQRFSSTRALIAAVVLVFVDQTTTIGNDAPAQTTSSVRVNLDKLGGRWLISQFDPV